MGDFNFVARYIFPGVAFVCATYLSLWIISPSAASEMIEVIRNSKDIYIPTIGVAVPIIGISVHYFTMYLRIRQELFFRDPNEGLIAVRFFESIQSVKLSPEADKYWKNIFTKIKNDSPNAAFDYILFSNASSNLLKLIEILESYQQSFHGISVAVLFGALTGIIIWLFQVPSGWYLIGLRLLAPLMLIFFVTFTFRLSREIGLRIYTIKSIWTAVNIYPEIIENMQNKSSSKPPNAP